MMANDVAVRRSRLTDAEKIAELAGQLGDPTAVKEMKGRLKEVFKEKDAAWFVADVRGGGLAGWVHVSPTPLLEVERRAEVNGLVVDERARSRRVGAMLLEAAEKWARGKGGKSVSGRSTVL